MSEFKRAIRPTARVKRVLDEVSPNPLADVCSLPHMDYRDQTGLAIYRTISPRTNAKRKTQAIELTRGE
jgi:hypothetical protein